MIKRNAIEKLLFVAVVAGLIAFFTKDYIVPSTWNYIITVEVDTPDGVKSGYAVRQLRARFSPQVLPEMHSVDYKVYGEAVIVDLGEYGTLFARISVNPYYEFFEAFPSPYGKSSHRKSLKHYKSLKLGSKGEVTKTLPPFNVFENSNDAKSIKSVPKQRFEETFGQGVKLKRVLLELTSEKVTWGAVDQVLPPEWYKLTVRGNFKRTKQ